MLFTRSHALILFSVILAFASGRRLDLPNPFLPPKLKGANPDLARAFAELDSKVQAAARDSDSQWNTSITSLALEITSAEGTLWRTSFTAPHTGNDKVSGIVKVTDQTYFRIASISKVFTVLAVLIQQKAGRWSIKDPITKHVPELAEHVSIGDIKWHEISLETLASQLSGIPREYGVNDLTEPVTDEEYGFESPTDVGLPPVSGDEISRCSRTGPTERPCSRKEFIKGVMRRDPIYEPNDRSTYSNVAFVLLGFALETLTNLPYEDVISKTIFEPLGMRKSTLTKPSDSEGIIPDTVNDWFTDEGIYGPTGGIYTTSADLALFARSIFGHKFLSKVATNSWFQPHSFSSSPYFAYGMPWEIYRTNKLLPDSNRVQTLITKGGNVRGYASHLSLVPEYDIGIVALVAGDDRALGWLREEILKCIGPAVENIARTQTSEGYGGLYVSTNDRLNSSMTVEIHGNSGLVLSSWISNGTDFLASFVSMSGGSQQRKPVVQLIPSNLAKGKVGEVWWAQLTEDIPVSGSVLDSHVTDVDRITYASRSVAEFVFELDASGLVQAVELPALRVKLEKQSEPDGSMNFGHGLRELMKPLGHSH